MCMRGFFGRHNSPRRKTNAIGVLNSGNGRDEFPRLDDEGGCWVREHTGSKEGGEAGRHHAVLYIYIYILRYV
jgi:hypothetical protein